MNHLKRWSVVVIFAIAMAWVESAVVFDLRHFIGRIEPYQPNPLPIIGNLGLVELVREAATLVMLLTAGILAGRTWKNRLGFTVVAFGVWDIFYYVFLKVMCGWPHSIWDWDILFLLPLPWWGPVLAPVLIALLMIGWGTLASREESAPKAGSFRWLGWTLNACGVALALYVFMTDCLQVAGQGTEVIRNVLPVEFNWPLFNIALVLMSVPFLRALADLRKPVPSSGTNFDWARWINHFARNRQNRPVPDWSEPTALPSQIRGPLLRSLEQFQLGDGGGPASLIARDAETFRGSTEQMRALVDAWFTEEREHSRLLGCAVDALGGQRIQSHWSFTAFCQCRRILGVKFELQVLLLTEISSTAYYRLLQRHSPIRALADTCGLILRDEAGHIAFHSDRLAAAGRQLQHLRDALWAAQFMVCGYAAATMLWINHSPCIRRLGGSTAEFYLEVSRELVRFLHSLVATSNQPVAAREFSPATEFALEN